MPSKKKPVTGTGYSTRETELNAFLSSRGYADGTVEALAQDASFRRYYRVHSNSGSYILMDAPWPQEDVKPFVRIAEHLRGSGLYSPKIIEKDVDHGFLLLQDFGDQTFTRLLRHKTDATTLYRSAVDVLVRLNEDPAAMQVDVPLYDLQALLDEVSLLPDWYFQLVHKKPVDDDSRTQFRKIWTGVFSSMPQPATSLVLRDFHVDNLMLVDTDSGTKCGLLDFQDALIGPMAYDLASLLQDARRDISLEFEKYFIEYYLSHMPLLDRENFLLWYKTLAAQRHAKVLGIFSRLCLRDGKCDYLAHLPRVMKLFERAFSLPSFEPLKNWMNQHFPEQRHEVPTIKENQQ